MGFCALTYVSNFFPKRGRPMRGLIVISHGLGTMLTNAQMHFVVAWTTSAWIYASLSLIYMIFTLLLLEWDVWFYTQRRRAVITFIIFLEEMNTAWTLMFIFFVLQYIIQSISYNFMFSFLLYIICVLLIGGCYMLEKDEKVKPLFYPNSQL